MKSKTLQRIIFIFSFTFCILQISGCAIFNPQVHSQELFERKYPISSRELANPDFAVAYDDASAQRNKYHEASKTYSYIRNIVPLAAGAAGMTGLILGTLGGGIGATTLTTIGVGTVGTVAISKYYDNEPRQELYSQAAIAVECIINAHLPLGFSKKQYDQLNTNLNKLLVALEDANALLAKYPLDHLAWNGNPGYSQADVIKKINQGDEIRGNATDFMALIDTAGLVLRGKVRVLVANVDREILKTEPDPTAMLQILNGLGFSTIKIGSGAKIQDNKIAGQHAFHAELNFSQKDVEAKANALDSAIKAVNLQLSKTSDEVKTKEKGESCKPPTAKSNLIVIPEDSVITMTAGESRQFTVIGGIGVPRAGLSGDFPSESVSQSIGLVNGAVQITVTTTGKAHGNATLSIFDGSGLPAHNILLNIIPVDNKHTVPPSKKASEVNRGVALVSKDEITANNKITLVQRALNVNQTGKIDNQTRAKLIEKGKENNLISDGTLSRKIYNLIIENLKSTAINNTKADEKLEKPAIDNNTAEIRTARQFLTKKLKLITPLENKNIIDVEFRKAIWDFQSENGLNINGILNPETYLKIIE